MGDIKYYYKVYGLKIESTICIPELEELEVNERCNIDINLSYGTMNSEIKEKINNGTKAIYKSDSMWFYIDKIAAYHVFNGSTIIIEPCEAADFKMIKLYILGSVMGLALLQRDMVAIHGGGVEINGKGCIFTGDKGAGKSTLTTALRKKGYKFVSDDVCSINSGSINKIYPGFPYQKLCEDAMSKLGYNVSEYEQFRGDLDVNKYMVPAFKDFMREEIPLVAIFEITVGDIDNVVIEEISGAEKINKIIKNIFRIEMLYYSGGVKPVYFKKCVDIAKNTKFYKITRPRNVFSVDRQIEIIEELILKYEESALCV